LGIVPLFASLLFLEARRAPFTGSVLQLGRQAIGMDPDELAGLAARNDIVLHPVPAAPLVPYQFDPGKSVITDDTFFRSLGFTSVHALDASDFEGADILFDLNQARVPGTLRGRFDLIFDGGTIEHVFHLPHCLANIHHMLPVGGRVIHFSPASNFMEHGFYSFSPCFFIDYYGANFYRLESLKLIRFDPAQSPPTGFTIDLFPGHASLRASLARIGGLDDGAYLLMTVAVKQPGSTTGRVPIQGEYRQKWDRSPPDRDTAPPEWRDGKWVLPWVSVPC
jgi:hypothetical protein